MERTHPAPHLPRRLFVAGVGITIAAALYRPLELDDLPHSLALDGRTAIALWGIVAALWCWVVWHFEVISTWCRQNRPRLLRLARHGGVYYGPILVALFYLMWVVGRLWLGYWPRAIPIHDPKGIPPSAVVHLLICGWFWYWPVALFLPIGRLVYGLPAWNSAARERVFELIATVLLSAVAAWWLATDPHQLVAWFLD